MESSPPYPPPRGKYIRFPSSSPPHCSSSLTYESQYRSKRQKTKTSSQSITTTQSTFRHTHTSLSTYRHQTTTTPTRRKTNTKTNSRKWVLSPHHHSRLKDEIVLVSYNILGVQNAENHPDLYCDVPPKYLNWERRKRCIRKELTSYNASILCLQEVDRFPDLAKLLNKDGYKGIYKARTGEACDGCAIFWREDLFSLMHEESIEFREFNLRDNVAQFCVLKMKSSDSNKDSKPQTTRNQALVIGNIHALFNPKRGDIKMGQIRLFVKKAHAISEEWGQIPVVMAGDINSTPKSAIYKFLASAELDLLRHNRRQLSGQVGGRQRWNSFRAHTEIGSSKWSTEELQLAAGSEEITHLKHSLQLSSAYAGVPGSSSTRDRYGEPMVTSYHSSFMGTVDYIWHSKDLVPVGVLETLPIDILRKMRGLPTEEWGSDHFALGMVLSQFSSRGKVYLGGSRHTNNVHTG